MYMSIKGFNSHYNVNYQSNCHLDKSSLNELKLSHCLISIVTYDSTYFMFEFTCAAGFEPIINSIAHITL